ncbi:hypothetical protein ACNT8L_05805 [Brucella intermedia]|uniref:hypothetical protein n=1 Tax=Brucella intermedia TaxID=94625 RepID=UPI003AB49A90
MTPTLPEEAVKAPERIRVAQDAEGFWTCREAISGSTEYIRADLAFLPVQGAVKKLKWGNARVTEDGREAEDAESPVGRYIATDTGWFLLGRTGYEVERGLYQSKAAAQADYEARILSALEPSAARELALEEGFRKGLEAACEVIDAHSEYDRQLCCDGRECGCYGATVHQSMQHYIRALSSPDHADDLAVDRFAIAMKQKLAKKREEGRGGWENKDECSAEYLSYLLIQHIWKGDPVDIANLAMMLHQRGERVVIDSETSFIIPDHADAGKVEGDARADLERFWRPISEADRTITYENTFNLGDGKSMTIRNSDHFWVRDADGRAYEATWSNHKGGYWWDLEGESRVDPVEYMPHPLSLPSAPSEGAE